MKPAKRDYSQFLIIDDDPGIAKFLVTYLRQRGHTCSALTDGFQTAAWLSENDCEVAIVDLKMPKVDGISLISFMRELNPTLPIVVFTGVGYDEEQMHAAPTRARTDTSAKTFRLNNSTACSREFSPPVSSANP